MTFSAVPSGAHNEVQMGLMYWMTCQVSQIRPQLIYLQLQLSILPIICTWWRAEEGVQTFQTNAFFFFFCPRRAAEAEVCEHNLGTINETKIVFNFWILAFSWQETTLSQFVTRL